MQDSLIYLLLALIVVVIFLLLKQLLKPKSDDSEKYTFIDYLNISLGKTNNVDRDNHKGFDYEHLIYDIRKYFTLVKVSGFSFTRLMPKFLSFGIGIIAKPKWSKQLNFKARKSSPQ